MLPAERSEVLPPPLPGFSGMVLQGSLEALLRLVDLSQQRLIDMYCVTCRRVYRRCSYLLIFVRKRGHRPISSNLLFLFDPLALELHQ